MTEVKYGYKTDERFNSLRVSFAEYTDDNNDQIEMINVKYNDFEHTAGLYVYKNNEMIGYPGKSAGYNYIMLWTKIIGWLGRDQLINSLR